MRRFALIEQFLGRVKALGLAAAMVAATMAAPTGASADVPLDNGLAPYGSYTSMSNFTFQMFPGMPGFKQYQTGQISFNSGSYNTPTDFTLALQNRGSSYTGNRAAGLVVGIMVDNGFGAPSGEFLEKTTVFSAEPYAVVQVTAADLNWTRAPDTQYWLEAVGEDGANYAWVYNKNGNSCATVIDAMTATLRANAAANVPELASLAIFGAAVVGLGCIRRQGKAGAAASGVPTPSAA